MVTQAGRAGRTTEVVLKTELGTAVQVAGAGTGETARITHPALREGRKGMSGLDIERKAGTGNQTAVEIETDMVERERGAGVQEGGKSGMMIARRVGIGTGRGMGRGRGTGRGREKRRGMGIVIGTDVIETGTGSRGGRGREAERGEMDGGRIDVGMAIETGGSLLQGSAISILIMSCRHVAMHSRLPRAKNFHSGMFTVSRPAEVLLFTSSAAGPKANH
jgi:hypothetical protein